MSRLLASLRLCFAPSLIAGLVSLPAPAIAQTEIPPVSASIIGGFDGAAVFRLVRQSVAILKTDNGAQGSAVAVAQADAETLFATNCHVLDGASSVTLVINGKSLPAAFYGGNPRDDACFVIAAAKSPVIDMFNALDMKVGEKVFAVGAPRGLELTISDGIVSGIRGAMLFDPPLLIQNTAPISPGSSGGGLFDARGRLVGISTFLLKDSQNLNFAVAINNYSLNLKNPPIRSLSRLSEELQAQRNKAGRTKP